METGLGAPTVRGLRGAGTSRGDQEVMAREVGEKQVSATADPETKQEECFRGTECQTVKCCGEDQ